MFRIRSRRARVLFMVFVALPGFVLFVALGGAVVMWLWNRILPPLFGWPALGFWQALGLLALCRILFGGFGMHGGGAGGRVGRRMQARARQRMRERWERMTPEERARFRARMAERWGFDPSAAGASAPGGDAT